MLALGAGCKRAGPGVASSQPGVAANAGTASQRVIASGNRTMASAVFSPDGKILGAIGDEKNVYLYNLESGQLVQQISQAGCTAQSLAFSPDGQQLAIGMNDGDGAVALVLGLQDGKYQNRIREIHQQGGRLYSIVFAGNGQQVLTEIDGNAITWEIATGVEVHRIEGGVKGGVCALSRAGDFIATGGSIHNDVTIWDAVSSGAERPLVGHTTGILAVAISPDGHTTASGAYDATVRLWNSQTLAPQKVLEFSDLNYAYALAFSNSGKMLATGGDGVRIWDPVTGVQQQLFASKETSSVAFSPDDHILAATSSQGTLTVWRLL
jgi:WD40 repeat protein